MERRTFVKYAKTLWNNSISKRLEQEWTDIASGSKKQSRFYITAVQEYSSQHGIFLSKQPWLIIIIT